MADDRAAPPANAREVLVPKLFSTLRAYDRAQFTSDAIAGVIVGVVALPLAIAFAIASGVTPDRRLWTAIVAGFIISAFGGSRVQIGGPTGAFVVIVYAIVQKYGIDGLTVATLMAGVILVAMGLAKFGSAIKFIPHPLEIGFTSAIAVIIFSGEVKDFLGLRMGAVPAPFLAKWGAYAAALSTISPSAVGVSVGSLLIILVWPRVSRRIPGPFVALVVATVGVALLHLPVETIGSRFGDIAAAVPHPRFPHLTLEQVTSLVGPAFTIAILAAVESLLSAVVADGMIGGKHRSNMELVAQGMANMVSPLFGGIPATGAIARTATNVKNGGRTPVAGIVHALTLLIITVAAGRWAAYIPMSALAAILVVVAYHMSEWRSFVAELRSPKSDVAVLLTTFLLTILVDLTVAIEVGMVLAAFLFIRRMASVTNVSVITREIQQGLAEGGPEELMDRKTVPNGVEVYEINGPFFFGAAQSFRDALSQVAGNPKVLILRMRNVPAMDSSGVHAMVNVIQRARKEGTSVVLSGVHQQPLEALTDSEAIAEIGGENVVASIDLALARAREILGQPAVGVPTGVGGPSIERDTAERR
jgi:SulP family sulfate permease